MSGTKRWGDRSRGKFHCVVMGFIGLRFYLFGIDVNCVSFENSEIGRTLVMGRERCE